MVWVKGSLEVGWTCDKRCDTSSLHQSMRAKPIASPYLFILIFNFFIVADSVVYELIKRYSRLHDVLALVTRCSMAFKVTRMI